MEIYYTGGFTAMMAHRQGLHLSRSAPHEMPARRTMIDFDADYRWIISESAQRWIEDNANARMWLRFDKSSQQLIIGAERADDLTLFATAF